MLPEGIRAPNECAILLDDYEDVAAMSMPAAKVCRVGHECRQQK